MASENSGRPDAEARARRPYWLVGLILLGVVAAMLVGAFLLDKQLRPSVGIESAPATAPKEMQTGVGADAAAQAVAQATVVPVASAAGSQSNGAQSNSLPEREIEQAYLRYWDVYAEAMLTLDTSRLPEVAAGERLKQAIAEVEKLKAEGKAAKIQVEHKYFVFNLTEKTATVHDGYVNNSYAVDPKTKQPIGTPGKSENLVDSYFLERTDTVWKVVNGVRESQ